MKQHPLTNTKTTSNLAMSRYLLVIVIFVIIGFVALLTEREYLFGSKKAQRNKHLHDHHLSYGSDDPLSSEDKIPRTPIPFKDYDLDKNKFNNENPPDPENLAVLKELNCLIYGPSDPLELVDLAEMNRDHEHDESEKLREKNVDLTKEYQGKITLFVNVASKCGFTDSGYKALVRLYEMFENEASPGNLHAEFRTKFRIAAVPSNDFGKQEPGTVDEIRHFALNKYGAKFHIYQKAKVRGADAIPLFKKLTRCSPEMLKASLQGGGGGGKKNAVPADVTWNWNFFLVDQFGRVVARFPPGTDAAKMAEAIDPLLRK